MSDLKPTVGGLAEAGAVPPRDFFNAPQRVVEIAAFPLDLPTKAAEAVTKLSAAGFFDAEALEEAITALSLGHLILAGPPGTGKTSLARALAAAFNARLFEETASPEWSVYDVIGTQTLVGGGTVAPKHGLVTNAVLSCATSVVNNLGSGEGEQAVWLLIDEMNRADIDRAFGPLFTALAGGEGASMILDYMDGRPAMAIPNRFRIIATVNEYDTRFVNSMSAALRRRFSKVTILPPANDIGGRSSGGEWATALSSATKRATLALGEAPHAHLIDAVAAHAERIREIFGFFRKEGGEGVPIGTAQIIDTFAFFLVFTSKAADDASVYLAGDGEALFWKVLDRALVARLVPSLETDSTRARLDQSFAAEFSKTFPEIPRTAGRIESFLHGRD